MADATIASWAVRCCAATASRWTLIGIHNCIVCGADGCPIYRLCEFVERNCRAGNYIEQKPRLIRKKAGISRKLLGFRNALRWFIDSVVEWATKQKTQYGQCYIARTMLFLAFAYIWCRLSRLGGATKLFMLRPKLGSSE